MKAVLIGSTGLVGHRLLFRLLDSPSVDTVISLSRKKLDLEHPKLTQLCAENVSDLLTDEKTQDKVKSCSHFFCALGSTIKRAGSKSNFYKIDFELVLQFALLAKKNAAHLSVISAMGASSKSIIFYNKVKGEMEEALIKLDLSSLHIFRPALLMGERKEFRAAEYIGVKLLQTLGAILPQKVRRALATDVEVLAQKIFNKACSPKKLLVINARDI